MKEQIEDIAKSIKRHRDLEIHIEATNNAVGRTLTLYNNEEKQFWLINKQATSILFQRDFNGNVIPGTGYSENTTYKGDGFPVPRDSKLGGLFIQFHEGKHKHQMPQGEIEIEIFNRASYNPCLNEGEYAVDILIKIAGDSKTHSFQNISKILSLQIEIDNEKVKLEQATAEEAEQLIHRIDQKEAEKKTYLDKAQGFIRKYAELRYQPILDPLQEAIKRSKIFDGFLIINGGPGTGKTTSLIQRIKFLISPSIEEYTTFTKSQKAILYNQKTSWIFYSPNELLALFLRNSMKMEELSADTERVKVWSSHKNELIKNYRFVTENKRPFLIYNKFQGKNLFINNSKHIKSIIKELNSSYLNFQKDKIKKVVEIDVNFFKWEKIGLSIQNYLTEKSKITNIETLIRLFVNLNETYKTESDYISNEYSALIKKVASRIQVLIVKEPIRANVLSDILKNWKTDTQIIEDDYDEEAAEIELEDFEENDEQSTFDFERELFTKLKSVCRKQALRMFDKNTRFSNRDKELLQLIPEIERQDEYEQLGQTAYFKKYFERITKGVEANIFREIPMIYKKFRREQFAIKSKHWDRILLEELVKKDKNSRIHSDEQALLLSFTNNISTKLFNSFKRQFDSINHPFVNGFKINSKPVIGIDEATDFSIIDLLAMSSFRHPELSSVTLSGDIMQRITSGGLSSWDDFSNIVENIERKDLAISYRQSPTLLSLAQTIYEKSTGKKANYISYIEKDKAEPKPLMLISTSEVEKLNWLAERIIEIYKAYGDSIPSIAIFLPEESQLEYFANSLGDLDILADVGILVKASRNGEVLGDKNTVRVFSIDKIKGLEFEAVFFHNIDELQKQNLSNDLLLKYIYVGISRATFYLGMTISKELNENFTFITNNFDMTEKTWVI